MSYAALDSYSTLLLYENQTARNIKGEYHLKTTVDSLLQGTLPLDESSPVEPFKSSLVSKEQDLITYGLPENELNAAASAILGIVTELPLRYSPDQFSVSLGAERVGMAGWIIDSQLGRDTELDEETVKIMIADLCERGLMQITDRRRLEPTEAGTQMWQQLKSK